MKLTTDQIKQILADAPESTHSSVTPEGIVSKYLEFNSITGFWSRTSCIGGKFISCEETHIDDFYSIHALSDLRTILEQHERIEKIRMDTLLEVLSKRLAIVDGGNECWIRVQDIQDMLLEAKK